MKAAIAFKFDQDTVIRLWAAQRVSVVFEGETLTSFLKLMKRDRFMPVRREALRSTVTRGLAQAPENLHSALLDTHASMREEARYYWRKSGWTDVAEFYRQSLLIGEARNLYAVISGLGETGSAADDLLLAPYTSHSAAKIRGAAIKALARLNEGINLEVLINALTDQAPSVSREALGALRLRASSVGGDRLWNILQSTLHSHVKRNALSLLEKLGTWDGTYYLVKAVCESDGAIARLSRLRIQLWMAQFNRTFSAPSREQLEKIKSGLEECGNLLDEETQEQLRFSLKSFQSK